MSDPSAQGSAASPPAPRGVQPDPIRLLLIEDDPTDARPVHDALEADGGFDVQWVTRLGAGLVSLRADRFDVVLADLGLPDSAGDRTVITLRAAFPELPVVVLVRRDEEAAAGDSIRAGAEDFVVKGMARGPFVVRAVRQALERHRIRLDVIRLALVDDLTGLGNRRAFLAVGGHRIKLSRRTGEDLALLAVALRRPPEPPISNGDGPRGPAGAGVDHVLRDAAALLRETLRESDVVARLGGDVFAVLLSGGEDRARGAMRRLVAAVQLHNEEAGRSFRLGFDVAVALFDRDRHDGIDDLLAEVPRLGPGGSPA